MRSPCDLYFDPFDPAARAALRAWRDLLPDAPRPATLTSDTMTVAEPPFLPARLHGRPVVTAGFVWVGDMADARTYLETFRRAIPSPAAEQVDEMRYVDLQSSGDERHVHGLRRYSAGHYLTEFSDSAIDAYLARGVPAGGPEPDWALMPGGGFQAYGGAIAEVGERRVGVQPPEHAHRVLRRLDVGRPGRGRRADGRGTHLGRDARAVLERRPTST